MRLAIAEVAIVVGLTTPGTIGTAVTIAGAAVLGYVVLLAIHVLTLRLEVGAGELRVASVLFSRRYTPRPGSVTRLAVEPRKGVFGTQLGGFGIEIGRGRTADGETVDVVRLAPVPSMLLVRASPRPVAVAPATERAFLRAMERGRVAPVAGLGAQPVVSDVSR